MNQARYRELLPYALICALALALRLIELADRPFQYDEGQVAYFSWLLSEAGDYHYQPVLHGPLTFFLTAFGFELFGDSDFVARLPFALAGTVIVALPYFIRRELGSVAALSAAVLFAISPAFLYYSRFAREDVIVTALLLGLIVVGVRLFAAPRSWQPAAIGALLAASFATKESTFITVAIFGSGLIAAQAAGLPVVRRLGAFGWRTWVGAAAAFALVWAVLFSSFFSDPQGIVDGFYEGPKYWAEQHEVNRGGEDWPFYLVVFAASEWLVLALGALGAVAAVRRRAPLLLALLWFFLAALVVYSYAGERFAWLVLQPLTPLVLLAGVGTQALWRRRRESRPALAALAIAVLALPVFAWSAARTSFERGADSRELLVVVQTAEQALRVREEVTALAAAGHDSIEIDVSGHGTFPWAWYFRDLDAGYADMTQVDYRPSAELLIAGDDPGRLIKARQPAYRGRRFLQRSAWARDYGALSPAAFVDWLFSREPWGEIYAVHQWLLVRRR